MSIISRLKVWIGTDTKDFEYGLNKSKKGLSGFSSSVKKIGGLIAGAFAFSSIKSFLSESKKAWDEQEVAINKLESVIKATGGAAELSADQMGRYASELQNATTYGDEVTVNAMAIMSTFKSIKGDVFKEAIKSAQDMAYVMGTDLNGAALQLGKALESPEIGLNALRRSGVSFSTEQIAQIKKLVAEGKKQEAQLIMLKELQTEFGGAAKNAANVGKGAQIQLTNAWGDFKEEVGKAITPAIKNVQWLTRVVQANTAVVADESIPTWKKLLGLISYSQNLQNKQQASDNAFLQVVNDEEIKKLKLYTLTFDELVAASLKYIEINRNNGGDYNKTVEAITLEMKARKSGIEAMTEQQKKMSEIAKMSDKSTKGIDDKIGAYENLLTTIDRSDKATKDTINNEIGDLKKLKAEFAALDFADVKGMSEETTTLINNKIKSYQNLLSAIDVTDTSSAVAYTREIYRLETLIAKNKELVDAKLRAEGKVEIMTAQPSIPIEGALIDNSENKPAFDEIVKLPEYLKSSSEQLKPIAAEMIDISGQISGAFADMAVGFGESIGQLIAGGGDLKGFAMMVASTFGDMAIQVGKIAIATGIATLGIKAALESLNPWAAIAAGVALVALGTAVKGALSDVAGGGSTFSSNTYSNNLDVRTNPNALDKVSQTVNVEVTGELKGRGSALVAVINTENKRKNLTT